MRPLPTHTLAPSHASNSANLAVVFAGTEARMRLAHSTHMGYPYNLAFEPVVPPTLGGYLINNLGDPYAGSHYGSEVCGLEREAIGWLMDLWGCTDHSRFWGSIGASGTEGNIWGIYLGREALPGAVLFHSADAHYSIPKAARLQRITAVEIKSNAQGEIDLDDLAEKARRFRLRPIILALTCGTTMKGAHDDIAGAIARLEAAGIPRERRYVHVDGALNAMVIPFPADAPYGIRPSFAHEIDSISTSGHKMIGTPMPCGALICRREHSERIAQNIAYLRSNDTTMMGSRNGHAVLAIWARFMGHKHRGFGEDARSCVARAQKLAAMLRLTGVPVLLNPHSLTVVFPQPSDEIVRTYQLACYKREAHAVVMPNVGEPLIRRFVSDYSKWRAAGAH